MPQDKYSATWVSHSSMRDFLTCSRAYFLNNMYRDPVSGHKIKLMSPALALGQAVHEVVESLSVLPTEKRFKEPLSLKYERAWQKVTGKSGGFTTEDQEHLYRERGIQMLQRVTNHPGPLANLAVKIKMDLPQYWLSEPDNIILCGKLDWLEYLPEQNGVHIIDFKTGKRDEEAGSLQLPIYVLLAQHCQPRPVVKASYWYLERSDELTPKELPDTGGAEKSILKIAKEIKLARKLGRFKCPQGDGGCRACRPLEAILKGMATKVGVDTNNRDSYILEKPETETGADSEIL